MGGKYERTWIPIGHAWVEVGRKTFAIVAKVRREVLPDLKSDEIPARRATLRVDLWYRIGEQRISAKPPPTHYMNTHIRDLPSRIRKRFHGPSDGAEVFRHEDSSRQTSRRNGQSI